MLYARENWLKDRQAFVVWHASIKTKGSCKRRFVPKSEVEEFIEGAMLLMNVFGIKIFEDTNTILRNRLIKRTRKKDWKHWISGIKWCSPHKPCLLLFQRKGQSSPHGSTRHEVHLALGVLTIGREPSQNRGLNTYRLWNEGGMRTLI